MPSTNHFSTPIFYSSLLVGFVLFTLVISLVLTQITVMPWNNNLLHALNLHLLLATACRVLMNVVRTNEPSLKQTFILFLGSLALASICVYADEAIVLHVNWLSHEALPSFFQQSKLLLTVYGWLVILVVSICSYLWYYVQEQQNHEARQQHLERLAREAELESLRQQLQPHFLFNSLNSINALIGAQPEKARTMVQQLSDFLRGTIKRDYQQLVPLAEELQHIALYLDIEKVRFGHRLQTELQCDPETPSCQLPTLLLQPLVENAIKFGLYETIGAITIRLSARLEHHVLHITVENPYDPTVTVPQRGVGFGLAGLQRRLYLIYGRQDLLTTHASENTFITTVSIPQSL
jgi:two-component system LytT family sensor kinase